MNRTIGTLLLFLFIGMHAFGEGKKTSHKRLTLWKEYLVGTGGSVGDLWALGSGGEYAFFRDDDNHEVSVSVDLFNDRTAYQGQKLLAPVLFNYRWYVGPEDFKGFYVTSGIGLAFPFGVDHGTGSFAWQVGSGYFVTQSTVVEFRYLGRRSQTVTNGTGAAFTTNNAFIGGMLDLSF